MLLDYRHRSCVAAAPKWKSVGAQLPTEHRSPLGDFLANFSKFCLYFVGFLTLTGPKMGFSERFVVVLYFNSAGLCWDFLMQLFYKLLHCALWNVKTRD